MNDLLGFAVQAHGGLAAWNAFDSLELKVSIGGAIWDFKQNPGLLRDVTYDMQTHVEQLTIIGFSSPGRRISFVPNRITLTTLDGTIIEAREVKPGTHARSDIRWHPSALDRDHRWQATGQAGATIWFTGLPASGKSTIAVAVERALVESGRTAYLLDGDNLRHGLSDDLGFSPGDRTENIRRVGHLTRLLADAGVVALASLVSPLKSDRETARALNDAAGLAFIEVHVATSLAECEKRDPKGLYARARSGELKGLTGVDAPYEPPEDADLVLDTAGANTEDLAAQVIAVLDKRSPRPSSS